MDYLDLGQNSLGTPNIHVNTEPEHLWLCRAKPQFLETWPVHLRNQVAASALESEPWVLGWQRVSCGGTSLGSMLEAPPIPIEG